MRSPRLPNGRAFYPTISTHAVQHIFDLLLDHEDETREASQDLLLDPEMGESAFKRFVECNQSGSNHYHLKKRLSDARLAVVWQLSVWNGAVAQRAIRACRTFALVTRVEWMDMARATVKEQARHLILSETQLASDEGIAILLASEKQARQMHLVQKVQKMQKGPPPAMRRLCTTKFGSSHADSVSIHSVRPSTSVWHKKRSMRSRALLGAKRMHVGKDTLVRLPPKYASSLRSNVKRVGKSLLFIVTDSSATHVELKPIGLNGHVRYDAKEVWLSLQEAHNLRHA